jgi:hypothetical protein
MPPLSIHVFLYSSPDPSPPPLPKIELDNYSNTYQKIFFKETGTGPTWVPRIKHGRWPYPAIVLPPQILAHYTALH